MIQATALINLGRDAELRQTSAGPVLSFTGASSTKRGNEEQTTWLRCSMFGKRATSVAGHFTKGTKLMVSGALVQREYKAKDGSTKQSLEMNVSDFSFAGGGKGGGDARGSQQSSTTAGGGFSDEDYGGGGDDDIPFD